MSTPTPFSGTCLADDQSIREISLKSVYNFLRNRQIARQFFQNDWVSMSVDSGEGRGYFPLKRIIFRFLHTVVFTQLLIVIVIQAFFIVLKTVLINPAHSTICGQFHGG
jgi:hypothetical protein